MEKEIKTKEYGQDFKPLEVGISKEDALLFNEDYVNDLVKLKQHITTVPTFIPKKFIDQIQFYDDGTDKILYLYINNTWRSIALT